MRLFISKRLPFGLRTGVLLNPMPGPGYSRSIHPGSTLARLGEGVAGVYVITGAHNMCKIGISTDPESRLLQLQTGSHVPLKLHYVLAVKSMDPRFIETEAHRILDKHRCAGEWFDVTPQMAEDAVNTAAAHFGIRTAQTTSDKIGKPVPARPMTLGGFVWYVVKPLVIIAAICVVLAVPFGMMMNYFFPPLH